MVANFRVDPRRAHCHGTRQKPKELRSASTLQKYISKGIAGGRAEAVVRFRNFATNALDDHCNAKPQFSVPAQGLDFVAQNWETIPQHLREGIVNAVERHSTSPSQNPNQGNASLTLQLPVTDALPSAVNRSQFLSSDQNYPQSSLSPADVPRPKGKARVNVRAQENLGPSMNVTGRRKTCLEGDSDDSDNLPRRLPKRYPPISFRIDEESKVVAFLYSRFLQIQQSTGKTIAKAWIKAICPKKQANYPYVDSNPRPDQQRVRKAYDGPPRIPIFWPDTEKCRHKEPDHTNKNERTYLLVHLIRLRWTSVDWERSNVGSEVPGYVKAGSWVGFLKEAFPIEKLAEAPGSTPVKIAQRQSYLRDIYSIAEKEEVYLQQERRDGSATYTFEGNFKMIHPDDVRPSRSRHSVGPDGRHQDDSSDLLGDTGLCSTRSPTQPMNGSSETVSTTSKMSSPELAAMPATNDPSSTRSSSVRSGLVKDTRSNGLIKNRRKHDKALDRESLACGGQPSHFSPNWTSQDQVHSSPQTLYSNPDQLMGIPSTWIGNVSSTFDFSAGFPTPFAGSSNMNAGLGGYRADLGLEPVLRGSSLESRTSLSHLSAESARYNTGYRPAQPGIATTERLPVLPQSEGLGPASRQSGIRGGAVFYAGRPIQTPEQTHPDDMLYTDHFMSDSVERAATYAMPSGQTFHSSQQTMPYQDLMPDEAYTGHHLRNTWS